jgi:hypothetical protein
LCLWVEENYVFTEEFPLYIVTYTGCGSVTNNSTWFGLDTGFIRYGNLQLLQVTITMITIALVASQIPLTEQRCADVPLRGLTDEDLTSATD